MMRILIEYYLQMIRVIECLLIESFESDRFCSAC